MAQETTFETSIADLDGIVSTTPVPKDPLLAGLTSLEAIGTKGIGAGTLKLQRFANTLHEVFSQVADLEIVPPLTDEEKSYVAGKVATFGAMREVTAPKPRRGKSAKATDPNAIPTDKPKP